MSTLSFQEKYVALGKNGVRYEGQFITAVKTTGIFCRPTCRARKPKIENVVFYRTAQEALQNGYRACKICKPMQHLGEAPEYVKRLLDELHENSCERIKDYDLVQRGIDPSRLRRWFKRTHNMTFHAYQRMVRINSAFNSIKHGRAVAVSAYESGYESLSGFNDGYRSIFGAPPTDANNKSVLNIVRFTTPIGPMYACASEKGVCLLEFTDRKMLETEFKDLRKRLNATILPGVNAHLDQVQVELGEYFAGHRKTFAVSLDMPGTEFQRAAWDALRGIPYGETRSYKQQATALGNPNAVRAVASANGHNRVSIVIPCHRVIGANGSLTGYGGGIHRKKWLLELEQSQRQLDLGCEPGAGPG